MSETIGTRIKYCAALIVWSITTVAYSVTLRVPSEYPTIQEAINASQHGDTVLVAPMTYAGPNNYALDFLGKRIVVRSEGGAAETIIDCGNLDRGVYFHHEEDSLSVLEGFTIANGYLEGESFGGGILCVESSPTIRHNVITSCHAYWGGGICCTYSDPLILDNTIIDNNGDRGGGLAILAFSDPVVKGNTIQDNTSPGG